jgi:hypothetical protein
LATPYVFEPIVPATWVPCPYPSVSLFSPERSTRNFAPTIGESFFRIREKNIRTSLKIRMFNLDAGIDHICAYTCTCTVVERIVLATRLQARYARYAPRGIRLSNERGRMKSKILLDVFNLYAHRDQYGLIKGSLCRTCSECCRRAKSPVVKVLAKPTKPGMEYS